MIEIRPQPGPQTAFLSCSADVAVFGGSAGSSKRLNIDTPIATPTGWSSMGDLKVGDQVFAVDGSIANVTYVSPIEISEDSFAVAFDSGEVIECDGEHLWKTMTDKERVSVLRLNDEFREKRKLTRPSRAKKFKKNRGSSINVTRMNKERVYEYLDQPDGQVRTTYEILETLFVRENRVNHSVAICEPLQIPKDDFVYDPYLVGMFLGDGCSTSGTIGCLEEDMNEMLQHVKVKEYSKRDDPRKQKQFTIVRFKNFLQFLRRMNLYKNKHIPISYLRTSIEDRVELLRGLMDTDGTCNANGRCNISLSNKRLIDDVRELVSSLGIKSSISINKVKGYGDSYCLHFRPQFPVFHLSRKLERQNLTLSKKVGQSSLRRYIISVYPIEPKLMRCIAIDHPSHLYLAGKTLIPTHNTFGLLLEASRNINNPDYGGVIFRREQTMITNEGGLRDTALQLYPHLGGEYRSQPYPHFIFPSGARISFRHLNQENDVLGWQGSQIPFIGYDELTHYCVDDQTEALTDDGWKLIKDIRVGEKVASLSKDREIQYQEVSYVYKDYYSGDMISYEEGLSFKVTPNHKMMVDCASYKDKKWSFDSWRFVEAKDLVTSYIPRTGGWVGVEDEYKFFDVITGRGYGDNNTNSNVEYMPMDDWLSFFGWYLSEGCSFRRNNRTRTCVVSLRQTKPKGQELLEEVLDRIPWRYSKTKDGQYNIFSRQLYEELHGLGNAYEKRVPRWIFSLSPRQINLFLDAFANGDGHIRKNGSISFGLANEGLVDDLQELYFLCGRISTKGYSVASGKYDSWRLNVSTKKRSHYQVKSKKINVEKYEGDIYCLTVKKNENFLMRRNGRYCWTGNSAFQFWYMFSRLRSTSGVRPYIRATTNPDAESWVADMLEWWIEQDSNSPNYGLPIPERSGVIRYFARINNELMWADSPEELVSRHGCDFLDAKSFTFIPAKITDNPILMKKDPSYLSNLKALTRVERARLLDGNWKVRPKAGDYFPRDAITVIDWRPTDVVKWIRSWDLAATEEGDGRDPDWTVGLLVGRRSNGKIVVADMIRVRRKAAVIESLVKTIAARDGKDTWILLPQDPGQSGKSQKESFVGALYDFTVLSRTITKNKVAIASGGANSPASLWQQGQIEIVRAPWNKDFIDEMDAFPTKGVHDDICDSFSTCVRQLPGHSKPDYSQSGLSGTYRPLVGQERHLSKKRKY